MERPALGQDDLDGIRNGMWPGDLRHLRHSKRPSGLRRSGLQYISRLGTARAGKQRIPGAFQGCQLPAPNPNLSVQRLKEIVSAARRDILTSDTRRRYGCCRRHFLSPLILSLSIRVCLTLSVFHYTPAGQHSTTYIYELV